MGPRLVVVSLSVSPVRDADGAIVEASVIARDVTATRRAERQRDRLQAVTAALSGATTPGDVVDVVLGEGFAAATPPAHRRGAAPREAVWVAGDRESGRRYPQEPARFELSTNRRSRRCRSAFAGARAADWG